MGQEGSSRQLMSGSPPGPTTAISTKSTTEESPVVSESRTTKFLLAKIPCPLGGGYTVGMAEEGL